MTLNNNNNTFTYLFAAIFSPFLGGCPPGLGAVTGLHIKLEETDVASASYFESHPAGLFVQTRGNL